MIAQKAHNLKGFYFANRIQLIKLEGKLATNFQFTLRKDFSYGPQVDYAAS